MVRRPLGAATESYSVVDQGTQTWTDSTGTAAELVLVADTDVHTIVSIYDGYCTADETYSALTESNVGSLSLSVCVIESSAYSGTQGLSSLFLAVGETNYLNASWDELAYVSDPTYGTGTDYVSGDVFQTYSLQAISMSSLGSGGTSQSYMSWSDEGLYTSTAMESYGPSGGWQETIAATESMPLSQSGTETVSDGSSAYSFVEVGFTFEEESFYGPGGGDAWTISAVEPVTTTEIATNTSQSIITSGGTETFTTSSWGEQNGVDYPTVPLSPLTAPWGGAPPLWLPGLGAALADQAVQPLSFRPLCPIIRIIRIWAD